MYTMNSTPYLHLSGRRFLAIYHLSGPRDEALARAEDICLEQTVEYPEDLIPRQDIRDQILGRVTSFEPLDDERFEARIEFPIETAGEELPQLLNVLFGNISIKPGYRLTGFELPQELLARFRGPRFGRSGLRDLLGAYDRPLLSTAIKPMGLSPAELAEYARQFALGGIDLIKDDHGLADQPFCRFEQRVRLISDAVRQANRETGLNCIYAPNITAPVDQIVERARFACRAGAGGYLVSPGLVGFDTMRLVADDDQAALPILCHPAFMGSFTMSPSGGIGHGALYGQICRLAGADVVIFPNYGGRFSFSEEECRDIIRGTESRMGDLRPIFPSPAGGMKVDRVAELCRFYGNESVLLIGGDLHRHGPDLAENCRRFAERVRENSAPA